MARRGSEKEHHLELRHQRTPDVIFSPLTASRRCPDAARAMLETLLPDSQAFRQGGQPRLLEIAVQGGSLEGRAGWVTVVGGGG